jgi:hypothetical protein
MLANLAWSGWAVVQSDDATEPYDRLDRDPAYYNRSHYVHRFSIGSLHSASSPRSHRVEADQEDQQPDEHPPLHEGLRHRVVRHVHLPGPETNHSASANQPNASANRPNAWHGIVMDAPSTGARRSGSRSTTTSRSRPAPPAPGVRPHCRFRKSGTESLSESGIRRMNGRTTRQCDRARRAPPSGTLSARRATSRTVGGG